MRKGEIRGVFLPFLTLRGRIPQSEKICLARLTFPSHENDEKRAHESV